MHLEVSAEVAGIECLQNQKRQKAAKTPPGSPGNIRSKQQSRQLPQGTSQAAGATTALTSKSPQGKADASVEQAGKRLVPAQQYASKQTAAAAPVPSPSPAQGKEVASWGQAGARPPPQQPAISFAEDGTLVRESRGSVASSPQQLAAGITNVQPLVPAKPEEPRPPIDTGAQAAGGPERQQNPDGGAAAGSSSRAATSVRSLKQGQGIATGRVKPADQGLAAAETKEPAASPGTGARAQAMGPLQLATSIKGLPPLMPRPAQMPGSAASGPGAAPKKEPVQAAGSYTQQNKQSGQAEGLASGVKAAGAARVTRESQQQAALPAKGSASASGSTVQASPSAEGISATLSGAKAGGTKQSGNGLRAKQQGASIAGSSGVLGAASGNTQDRAAQPPAARGKGAKAGSSRPVPAAASAASQEGPSAASPSVAAAQSHGARVVEALPSAPTAATAASSPAEPPQRSITLRQAGSAPSDVSSASRGAALPGRGQAEASSTNLEAGSINGRASASSGSHGNGTGTNMGSGSPTRSGTERGQAGAGSSSQGTADNARTSAGSASSLEAGREAASAGSGSQGGGQHATGSGAQGTNTIRSKLGSAPPATLFIKDAKTGSSGPWDDVGAAQAVRGPAAGGMPASGEGGSAVAAAAVKGTAVGSEAAASAGTAEGKEAGREQAAADRPSSRSSQAQAAAAAAAATLAGAQGSVLRAEQKQARSSAGRPAPSRPAAGEAAAAVQGGYLEGTRGVQRVSEPAQDPLDDAQAVSAAGFDSELLPGRPGSGAPHYHQREGTQAAMR